MLFFFITIVLVLMIIICMYYLLILNYDYCVFCFLSMLLCGGLWVRVWTWFKRNQANGMEMQFKAICVKCLIRTHTIWSFKLIGDVDLDANPWFLKRVNIHQSIPPISCSRLYGGFYWLLAYVGIHLLISSPVQNVMRV